MRQRGALLLWVGYPVTLCVGCDPEARPGVVSPSTALFDARFELTAMSDATDPFVDITPDAAAPGGDAGSDDASARDAVEHDGDASDAARAGSIVGVWHELSVPGCIDEHTFSAEGRYTITSTPGEVIVGRYRWTPGTAGARGELWVIFDSDNGSSDCHGIAHVETGASHTGYVEFRDPDAMLIYRGATGSDLWFVLHRR